jgi:hypothetical protein
VKCGRDFFDLQLRFAGRAAEVAGVPLATALLHYTNLYVRFGLGRDFVPENPEWRAFLVGLAAAADAPGWTWAFYRRRPDNGPPPFLTAQVGCFAYARLPDGRLRLHFDNVEPPDQSPLALDQAPARRAELAALMAEARRHEPAHARVVGLSWLYNLPAYRRLFPASYIAGAQPAGTRFRNMPLWGQFLDRHGAVRPALAATLLDRTAEARRPEELAACFPFQPLAVEAALADFA